MLILVLGMLGLLALIGVTFATFSSQARINARNFALSDTQLNSSDELMNFALAQLIDDTANPLSAIRGHSLRRDMYGNDAANNGYLTAIPRAADQSSSAKSRRCLTLGGGTYNVTGTYQCITNILLSTTLLRPRLHPLDRHLPAADGDDDAARRSPTLRRRSRSRSSSTTRPARTRRTQTGSSTWRR